MSASVRFSKLPSQGVIYGIDQVGFYSIVAATVVGGTAVIGEGLFGIVTTAPITVTLVLFGVLKLHGQSVMVHILREGIGLMRKATGGTKYRARPEKKRLHPESSLNLPGWSGRLHLYETAAGAVVVWDAVAGAATISCMVATPGMGAPLVDAPSTVTDEQRDGLIWEWAKVLGSFTQKAHVKRVCVLEQTRPGTVAASRRYFDERVADTGSEGAASYKQALNLADDAVVMHVTQLSVTFALTAEARRLAKGAGGGIAGMIALAEMEMQTVEEALLQAGFTRVAWMSPREWGAWGRSMIDPASQGAIDSRLGTLWEGADPQSATPMLVTDERSYVETDSAWHRTFWINEWPRYETHPGFLSRLVFAKQQSGASVRHTFALVAAPIPVGKAMKKLEQEKRTWASNANLRAKTGKPESAADVADWTDIQQHEADLVAGQGELRFSAYLTVTAPNRDELERSAASMLNACAATGLEPRLLPWQQWEALSNVAYPAGLGLK